MAKLYCIISRAGDTAVIFRRGPSKQVRLIGWNLSTQAFTPGQWFSGRIYARKSDLSPNGKKLVYYAAKFKGQLPTWIAVSTPPYLTAHVLWRATGTWNDLSLFESNDVLALATYRSDSSLEPQAGFKVPGQLRVKHKPWPGYFHKLADHDRLIRDGWLVIEGDPLYRGQSDTRVVYRKHIVDGARLLYLELSATGEADVSYSIHKNGNEIVDLKAEWADTRGKYLYFSQGAKLFSIRCMENGKHLPAVELADFGEMRFEAIETPPQAMQW